MKTTEEELSSTSAHWIADWRKSGHWFAIAPSDDAATKLIWLAIQNAGHVADKTVWGWKTALNQFVIMFEDRMPNRI